MEKPRCRICGKEYRENNPAFLKMLSVEMQEKLKYIPACDCLEKEKTAQPLWACCSTELWEQEKHLRVLASRMP